MNNELSTYAVAILDHIKNNTRVVPGYGKVSSVQELKVAFGIKRESEELEELKAAIKELAKKKLILEIQRGALSITPLGNTYRPNVTTSSKPSAGYILNQMEMGILQHFYERTNKGHEKETIKGLTQDVCHKYTDWTREQVEEAIKVLVYQKFLDKKDVSSKMAFGMGGKKEYMSVKTHYVLLSGKALMLLSNRDASPHMVAASIHVAESPYSTRRRLEEVFAAAKSSIRVVDAYIGRKTLDYLLSASVPIKIITSSQKEKNFDQALIDFQTEFKPGIEVRESNAFHGRVIILDESRVYLIDHSIKDFGSKPSSIVELTEPEVQKVYNQLFNDSWGE